MKWFLNLKTGMKLGLGFGCCLVLASIVGVTAITRMGQMDKGTKLIVADPLAGTASMAHLNGDIRQYRIYEYRYLLETGADRAGIEADMSKDETTIQQQLADYEKSATLPEDVANSKEMTARWAAYLSRKEEQMTLARRNDEKAGLTLLAARKPAFDSIVGQLDVVTNWNKKRADELAAEATKTYQGASVMVITLLSLSILMGIGMAIVITRIITSNLALVTARLAKLSGLCAKNLDAALQAAALGDINATVETGTPEIDLDSKDEFGVLAQTFNKLLSQVKSTVHSFDVMMAGQKEKVEVAATIASGDLTRSVTPKSDKDQLGHAFVQMVSSLSDLVSQARLAADTIAQSSAEVSAGNEDLSQRTEEQASSLEETASSMEEMTSTVKQNADSARQANQLASQARDVAEKGGSLVKETVASMGEISSASKRIADIISVIDEIAFQTNLLALNAAVEAARVGEQGRGFAVVAAEVRGLAGRSATAAKEIKALVQDSVQKVEEGSNLVNQSGQQLQEIVLSVKKVADIIAEISAASQEQATGIEQVNKAVMQMDQITQQNAALVEEASATSQGMNQQAKGLQTVVSQFQLSPKHLQALEQQMQSKAAKPAAALATGTHGRTARIASPRRPAANLQLVRQDDSGFEEF